MFSKKIKDINLNYIISKYEAQLTYLDEVTRIII